MKLEDPACIKFAPFAMVNYRLAKRSFRRLLGGLQYKPQRIVNGRLRSQSVGQRAVLVAMMHRESIYLSSRAGSLHRPTRQCER